MAFGPYQDRSDHQRKESDGSIEASDPPSPMELAPGGGALTVPTVSLSNQNRRSGRSPLARVSLIRTASNDGLEIELEDQQPQSRSSSHSPKRSGQQKRGDSQ
jgi:chitin synthase